MKKFLKYIVVILLLSTPTGIKAETIIQNSVSVTTNGGVSTTIIKTTQNGEIIEDINISTTTPFHYQSKYQNGEEVKNSINKENLDRINQINSLIKEFQTLLSLYEKLLANQNTK